MANFIGTSGDDVITGTDSSDFFDMSQGGNDIVSGLGGKDTFYFGATLTADDQIDGGANRDTVILKGDYSAGLVFGATTMVNVERLVLDGGFSYNLTTNDATVQNALDIDASKLHAGDKFIFNGSAETSGGFDIVTNAGHANLTGGAGSDTFEFGATFNTDDRVYGGGGFNAIVLNGDYSGGLTFDRRVGLHITNDYFVLKGHFAYDFTFKDGFAAPGETRSFYFHGARSVTVDASAMTAGGLQIAPGQYGDHADVTAVLGAGDDIVISYGTSTLDLSRGGDDYAYAGDGTLLVKMGASLTAADHIQADGGVIAVQLDGDYSAGVVFGNQTMLNVSNITLAGGHSYSLTVNEATLSAGHAMTVDGSALGAGDSLIFDASADTDATYTLKGGAGADTLTAGAHGTVLQGGGGADMLVGGGGPDNFVYGQVADSTGITYDTVVGFNALHDFFTMPGAVTKINAEITSGTLDDTNAAVFNADMAAAVDAAHLGAHHAVVFDPDSGSLAGATFLVVDMNGVAGYQADADIVIRLDDAVALDLLKMANFHQ